MAEETVIPKKIPDVEKDIVSEKDNMKSGYEKVNKDVVAHAPKLEEIKK